MNVLIVGLGRLGSHVAPALADHRLHLCDFDRVEAHNIAGQPLYREHDLGALKAEVAARNVRDARPIATSFDASMLQGMDLVMDCTDDPATRVYIHASCLEARIPLVWGAVERNVGLAMVILPGGPCLRCLWGSAEPHACTTLDDEAAARTGRRQAELAAAWIAGASTFQGAPLRGTLWLFDDGWHALHVAPRGGCCAETA